MRTWNIKEGKEGQTIKDAGGRGQAMNLWPAFSPDSKNIAWPSADGVVLIYDVANGKEVQKLGEQNADRRPLRPERDSVGLPVHLRRDGQPYVGEQLKWHHLLRL